MIITEGSLSFHFESDIVASKYDDWSHYRNQFQNKCSADNKAVDIIAYRKSKDMLWLCEVKDFRTGTRNPDKPPLEQEIAQKVRDSLAGLVSAKFCANDEEERSFACNALACEQIRVVLHIEQPNGKKQIYNLSDLKDQLKRLLKAIDPHPLVIDQKLLNQDKVIPWQIP